LRIGPPTYTGLPMLLRDISMRDLELYEGMLTDPRMMSELGGPLSRDGLDDKLRGIVEQVESGTTWYRVIVLADGTPAGTVCIWDHDQGGEPITEIGWMVRPELQGRGLATQAVREILRAARAEGRWHAIHAFPGVTNPASSAICQRLGFSKDGELDIEYAGRTLRCNKWVLDLAGDAAP
jgi:RimJ/RimL family protein N-acetyltransferase